MDNINKIGLTVFLYLYIKKVIVIHNKLFCNGYAVPFLFSDSFFIFVLQFGISCPDRYVQHSI